MPLILITGYPTSGKTHRARQILSDFQQRISTLPPTSPTSPPKLRIYHISDSTLSIPRHVYDLESKSANERSNNASEKDARAKVYAEVKRLLSRDDIVICDAAGGNYIKGWRYQLYCEAKALRTPSCVVHVGTPVERAREINEARLKQRDKRDADANAKDVIPETRAQADEEPYDPSTWENLVFRHEEPNPMARWDSPLFTVLWDDSSPPFDAIWTALIGSTDGKTKVVVRPNQATVLKPSAGEDYLYTLDRATQEVLGAIKVWMGDHVGEVGGVVEIDDGKGEVDGDDRRKDGDASGSGNGKGGLVVELPVGKEVGLAALQRLRRQFIAMNRQNSVPVARIKETFVGYLNDSFQAA